MTTNELVMLAVQKLQGDGCLLNIVDLLSYATGRKVSVGNIGAALNKLQSDGLISSRKGEPAPVRGGKAKIYFALTERGKNTLSEIEGIRAKLREL